VRRANNLEKIVKAKVSDAEFTVNAEKPRKGAFVVTVNGTEIISLLDMPRPFGPLKALDIEVGSFPPCSLISRLPASWSRHPLGG